MSPSHEQLVHSLKAQSGAFASVVPPDLRKEKVLIMDFTSKNPDLKDFDLSDVRLMSSYIFDLIEKAGAVAGAGGYNEERSVYQKSAVFDLEGGSRSIHLGIDIWMPAKTTLYCPWEARLHSFQDNAHFGDYGPTLILEHELETQRFYTLYGHLSRESLEGKSVGMRIQKGEALGAIGDVEVNGHWAPHLHFQVMRDMLGRQGDFIGVAPNKERDYWLDICPDANLILEIPGL